MQTPKIKYYRQLQVGYREGFLVIDTKRISKFELHSVGIQEIRWEGGGTEPAGKYAFFYGN
jgi:hypothetical protein